VNNRCARADFELIGEKLSLKARSPGGRKDQPGSGRNQGPRERRRYENSLDARITNEKARRRATGSGRAALPLETVANENGRGTRKHQAGSRFDNQRLHVECSLDERQGGTRLQHDLAVRSRANHFRTARFDHYVGADGREDSRYRWGREKLREHPGHDCSADNNAVPPSEAAARFDEAVHMRAIPSLDTARSHNVTHVCIHPDRQIIAAKRADCGRCTGTMTHDHSVTDL